MNFNNTSRIVVLLSCFASALGQSDRNGLKEGSRIPDPNKGICSEERGRALRSLQEKPQQKKWAGKDLCTTYAPGEVVNFHVTCNDASYLDFQIADCCMSGDHWQLKGKNWDTAPQTAVTTSPGRPSDYSVPARVYNYGGTSFNPGSINALVECTYLHGVDVFGASSYVYFESDASNCNIEKVTVAERIDRSP